MIRTQTAPPTVIVTGLKRSGLNLMADMLREGGVPDLPFRFLADSGETLVGSGGICIAPDPHDVSYLKIDPKRRAGIFVERETTHIIDAISSETLRDNGARLSAGERLSLARRLARDFRPCRDAAALAFSPMFMFRFEQIIADPEREARRLARLMIPYWPQFSERRAALAVRRIVHVPRPRPSKPALRVVQTQESA